MRCNNGGNPREPPLRGKYNNILTGCPYQQFEKYNNILTGLPTRNGENTTTY
jgi:hypothetical protein